MELGKGTYGEKYNLTYNNAIDCVTVVKIYEREFDGVPQTVKASGEPFILTLEASGDSKFATIKGESATIEFISETDFNFLELYTSDARKYLVDVIKLKAGETQYRNFWRGYILPDIYSEPFTSPPYTVQLTATCGLSILKNEDFDLNGIVSLFDIIIHIINKIGTRLDVVFAAFDVYETNMESDVTDEPFKQCFLDVSKLFYNENNTPSTCYDVLTEILKTFGARIYQNAHLGWYIVRVNRQRKDYLRRHYSYTSLDSPSMSIDTKPNFNLQCAKTWDNNAPLFISQSAQIEVDPAWKAAKATLDYGLRESMILNHNFKSVTYKTITSSGRRLNSVTKTVFDTFKNWSHNYNDGYNIIYLNTGGRSTGAETHVGLSTIYHTATGADRTYLTSDGVDVLASQKKIKISITYYSGIGSTAEVYIRCGNYHLKDDGSWQNGENIISLPYSPASTTFELTASGFPCAGKLEVQLRSPDKTAATAYYNDIVIFPLSENGNSPAEDIVINETVNENNNTVPEDLTFIIGDLPTDIDNAKCIYNGGLLLEDGTPTTNWFIKDTTESGTLFEIVMVENIDNYRKPSFILSGTFVADILFSSIIRESRTGNRIYMFNSCTYKDKSNEYDVELAELTTPSIVDNNIILQENWEPILTENNDVILEEYE